MWSREACRRISAIRAIPIASTTPIAAPKGPPKGESDHSRAISRPSLSHKRTSSPPNIENLRGLPVNLANLAHAIPTRRAVRKTTA